MGAEEFLNNNHFHLIMDSRNTNILNGDIERAMQDYATMKCKELLEIVAEKADKAHVGGWDLDRDEVLNAVDLNSFCK